MGDILIEIEGKVYPIEIKTTANPNAQMVKHFSILREKLPETDIQVAHGTIINQYPQKV